MKKHNLFIRILALLLSLALLAGCGAPPEDISRGDLPTTGEDPGISRDTFTNGQFDYFEPEAISSRHQLQFVNNFSKDTKKKQHTVLIYLVGSDLESRGGYASRDLMEMIDSGFDTEKSNLIVYAGGSKNWNVNLSSACNSLLRLSSDGGFDIVAGTQEAANMGNARVLADFLNFAYKNFPAEQYSLIFWDHGGGPIHGYGSDEQFSDMLGLYELEWAMEASPFKNRKLEMVGFDACLMASIEIADLFAPYAKYMVASEELEPGKGWDYGFLNVYNSGPATTVVTQRILNDYKNSFGSKTQYTLSCMDLSQIHAANQAANELFLKMAEGCLSGDYTSIAQQRDKTKRFAVSSSPYDLVDLGHMAQLLGNLYRPQVQSLQSALEKLVIQQVSNVEHTNGVTVYYPYDNQNAFTRYGEVYAGAYYDCQGYQLFIKAFASKWIAGRPQLQWADIKPDEPAPTTPPATTVPPETTVPPTTVPTTTQPEPTEPSNSFDQLQPDETYLTWQIDPSYREVYSSASYTILRYNAETDSYIRILSDNKAIIDDEGVIYVPSDPYVFTMDTDLAAEPMVWYATQAESTSRRNTYYSAATLLASGDVIVGSSQPIEVLFSETPEGEVILERVLTRNEDAQLFGKTDVELSNWSSFGQLSYDYYLTRDTAGNILPVNQWSNNGWLTVEYIPYDQQISLQRQRLSETDGEYYLELSLTDVQGQSYNVAYQHLKAAQSYEITEYPTNAGVLTYHVYEDHAELVGFESAPFSSYSGDEPVLLSLPDMISRQPVTVIDAWVFRGCGILGGVTLPRYLQRIEQGAFRGCYNMKEVTLHNHLQFIAEEAFLGTGLETLTIPDSVTAIGWRAFAVCELTTATLPASVTQLGTGVFYGNNKLTAIEVAAGNPHYTSLDGVLFSADGKTLLGYPAGKGSAYTVPAGTQVIAAEAFRGCETLTEVTLPEGLVKIAPLAFCNTLNLSQIRLPDSLEIIGSAAFGMEIGAIPAQNTHAIQIGPNVSWIGEEAFNGYLVESFRVADGNKDYSADGIYLMNASGSRLIRVANQAKGIAQVPDTVNHIDSGAFSECTALTEVILQDSVTSIAAFADIPTAISRLSVGKSLLNWNNLSRCAGIPVIEISPDNPNFRVVDGNIYNSDITKLLLFVSQQERCTLPDSLTEIVSGAFLGGNALPLKQLTLPASLEKMPDGAFGNCANLEEIHVSDDNLFYTSYDGLLYNADGTVLIAMPMGKTGSISIRPGTVEIARGAIYDSSKLQADAIIFPEGLIAIRDSNLMSRGNAELLTIELPASLTDIHSNFLQYFWGDRVQVICPAGSVAEQYVQSLGLPLAEA